MICAGMIFMMVVIGGATRLTESGLSITQWKPVTGMIPPLSDADWMAEFRLYQQIPEYQLFNQGMSLDDFKNIYWWEYFHRLWGRLIGLVFFVPLVFFAVTRALPRPLLKRLGVIFALGGLQGFIGWWMVKSGLSMRTDVSHYRLTVHLLMAFVLFVLVLWHGLLLLRTKTKSVAPDYLQKCHRQLRFIFGAAFVVFFFGAMVAGLNAGMVYNTFPLMDGSFMPSDVWHGVLLDNPAFVQFMHRWMAVGLVLWIVMFWVRLQKSMLPKKARMACVHVMAMALVQATLGIKTLIFQVPVALGVLHQAGAVMLLGFLVWALFETYTPKKGG